MANLNGWNMVKLVRRIMWQESTLQEAIREGDSTHITVLRITRRWRKTKVFCKEFKDTSYLKNKCIAFPIYLVDYIRYLKREEYLRIIQDADAGSSNIARGIWDTGYGRYYF